MWLNKLQLAIIDKDPKKINTLVEQMPQLESIDDMKKASVLIKEALKLLHTLKDETASSMKQLKKHQDFLKSTTQSKINRLDITS